MKRKINHMTIVYIGKVNLIYWIW